VDKRSVVNVFVATAPDAVSVPDLTGKTPQEAQTLLAAQNLTLDPNQPTEETDQDNLVGKVTSQNPTAGQKVSKGSAVSIKIGKAPDLVPITDTTGQTFDTAKGNLTALGFVVQRSDVDSAAPADQVVDQSPKTGKAKKGATITLSVSKGNQIKMPDLTGMTKSDAQRALQNAGWSGQITYQDQQVDSRDQDGKVQGQQPQGGTSIAKNQPVTVLIGRYNGGGGSITFPTFPTR
jgi:serine/threonine-protein kinase